MKKQILLLLGFLLLISGVNAQVLNLQEYKKKYPEDKYVVLKKHESATLSLNKEGKIEIKETSTEEVLYLTDMAVNYSERHIPFSSLNVLLDYEAYTLIPNGTKYVKKEVNDYKLIDKYLSDNFHDDHKGYVFHLPNLQEGAISYYTFTNLGTEPYLYGSFDFSREVPVVDAVYEITVPSNIKIQVKQFNCENFKVQKDSVVKKGNTVYRFSLSDVKKFPYESGSKSPAYYRPKLLISIVSYEKDGKIVPVLKDEKDLAKLYCDLIKKAKNNYPAELKKVTDSLKANNSTEEEKVKAVFYWVQDNIRYISIQEGMGGFIPTDVQTCFQQRFGDCKAMSNLIYMMLKNMGISANYGLVGTRSLPYSYRYIPGAFIDNHMICMYESPTSGWKILDATGRYIPYGTIPDFIQGKEIFIIKDDCNYEIYDVPVVKSTDNVGKDSIYFSIKDNLLLGSGKEFYFGSSNINMNHALLSMTELQKEKYMQSHLKKGSAKCILKESVVNNLNDRSENLTIDYKIELRDYAIYSGNEIIINPHLKRSLASTKIDTLTQRYDSEYESTGQYIFTLVLEIPEGYTIDYLPENRKFNFDKFGFDMTYTKIGNTIQYTSIINIDTLYITKVMFPKWNEMVNKLNKAYNETIVLKKKL